MEITNAVPLPEPNKGGRRRIYPFPDMEVGDSFAVPLSGDKHLKGGDMTANRVGLAARRFGRLTGRKFTIRTVREEGVVRCWRIE